MTDEEDDIPKVVDAGIRPLASMPASTVEDVCPLDVMRRKLICDSSGVLG
jgi:hypothetical protein